MAAIKTYQSSSLVDRRQNDCYLKEPLYSTEALGVHIGRFADEYEVEVVVVARTSLELRSLRACSQRAHSPVLTMASCNFNEVFVK